MQSFLYPLISATSFGISNAYWRNIEKAGFTFQEAIFYRGLVSVVLLSALWLIMQTTPAANITKTNIFEDYRWLKTIAICLVCSMGLVCFVPSLRYKTVAVVVSVSSINLFGILTAMVFFGEAFLPKHLVSLSLAAVGVLLVALKNNQASHNFSFDLRSVALPLLAAFFWGVGYTLFKIPLQWMTPLELGIAIEVIVWLVSAVLLLLDAKVPFAKFKTAYTSSPHFYVAGMLLMIGSLFTNIGLSKLPIAELNILWMFNFPVSMVSERLLYKENKTTATEWAGIVLIFASILLTIVYNP